VFDFINYKTITRYVYVGIKLHQPISHVFSWFVIYINIF